MNPTPPESILRRNFPWLSRLAGVLLSRRTLRCLLFVGACVVTLLGLYYAVENWRGYRALKAHKQAMIEKGEWVEWLSLWPAPVPDADNFAMTPFLAPLFDFVPGTQTWRDTNAAFRTQHFADALPSLAGPEPRWRAGLYRNLPGWQAAFQAAHGRETYSSDKPAYAADAPEPLRREAAAAVLAGLKPWEPVVEELRTASRRPHSQFQIARLTNAVFSILLPHLSLLRTASEILSLRASAELGTGQTEAALEDVLLGLRLSDSLREEPIMVSHLVRLAILDRTLQPAWEGLARHQWSESQLKTLQERWRHLDLLTECHRALLAERAGCNLAIESLARHPEAPEFDMDPWGRLLPRGWFSLNQVVYDRAMHDYVMPALDPKARRVHPKMAEENLAAMSRELDAMAGIPLFDHGVLARLIIPAYNSIYRKASAAQTAVDQAAIACAIERHRLAQKALPGKLDDLAPQYLDAVPRDICDGQPLRYRPAADGAYLLYSVGWNEQDEGGTTVVRPGKKPAADLSQGDWVWRGLPAGRSD